MLALRKSRRIAEPKAQDACGRHGQICGRESSRGKSLRVRLWQAMRNESGQALALYVVSAPALMAIVGLAIDVEQVRFEQQQMQAAVDAAALAGALEMSACGSTEACSAMTTAAKSALAENGLSVGTPLTQCAANSNSGLALTVNNGPCFLGSTSADPNYHNSSYVEAVLTGPVNLFFGSVVGFGKMNITVRAEAGGNSSQYCMVLSADNTSSSAPTGMTLNSSGGKIDASCAIEDDSGGPNALESDPGITVDSTEFQVHGSWSPDNGGTFTGATPVTGAPALNDPLSYLTPPTPAGSCTNLNINSSETINQGTYCGLNVNSGITLTLNAGTYIFEGGVSVDGSLVGTSGVTLYLTSGALNFNSGSSVQLSAPTTGSLAGIVIWQASSDSGGMNIDTGANAEYNGAIYAPTAELTLNAGSNSAGCTLLDVGSLMLDSNANFDLGLNCSSFGGSPFHTGSVNVVE
jgi:hypothetical protein